MKIAVYAIAKDESKFAERWYESMKEADAVYVLDTGSTDGTPDILRGLGAKVAVQVVEPFKFNVARNTSLALVPPDVDWCVCTDIDEYFTKGWRAELERCIAAYEGKGLNSVTCNFITAFDAEGRPLNAMDYWKIHTRRSAHWEAQCHEYLAWDEPRVQVHAEGFHLEHHPDETKPRTQYLPMLERAVLEERTSRHLFYYGRELIFHGRDGGAIAALMEYLAHPDSRWNYERAWAMRFIARCLSHKCEYNLAVHWYVKAAEECVEQRESLVEYAKMCRDIGETDEAIRALELAVKRTRRPEVFFTEDDCWDGSPERLLEELKTKKEATC